MIYITSPSRKLDQTPPVQQQQPFMRLRPSTKLYAQSYANNNITVNTPKQPIDNIPKVTWGRPTWKFFHVLSIKIKDEYFQQLRPEMLNIINSICSNLPCPKCAEHARQYMNTVNFNSILTKEDFIKFLFIFHNEVNKRKNYPVFKYDDLHSTYSMYDFNDVCVEFINKFQQKTSNSHQIANEMHRSGQIKLIKSWILTNVDKFM